MLTLLIDGGALLQKGWHAAQPDRAADTARRAAVHALFKVLAQHQPTGLGVFFDAPPSPEERKRALWPQWKATRARKPDRFWDDVIKPVMQVVGALGGRACMVDHTDADDLIATTLARANEDAEALVFTRCQRMHQLLLMPGVEIWDGERVVRWADASAADNIEPARLIDLLCLTGSKTDNLPGLDGIGPKHARTILGTGSLADVLTLIRRDLSWQPPIGKQGERVVADLRQPAVQEQLKINEKVLRLDIKRTHGPRWSQLTLAERDNDALASALQAIQMNKLAAWVRQQEDTWGEPPEEEER